MQQLKFNKQHLYLSFLTFVFLASCQSNDHNEHWAFDKVKLDKENQVIKIDSAPPAIKVAPVKREYIDSFRLFETEINRVISINEVKIKTIKGTPNVNLKLLKKVTALEKTNNEMRLQLTTYETKEKERWMAFKLQMRAELEMLHKAILELDEKK